MGVQPPAPGPTLPSGRETSRTMRSWTTADRPVGEQVADWREVICEAFAPLAAERGPHHTADAGTRSGIESWVRSSRLTGTNCAEVSSRTQLISHGRAEVRRTASEEVFVNLQLKGSCIGRQDDRTCVVPAGGFALFDTTSEYHLDFVEDPRDGEWRVLSFRVPRASLVPMLATQEGFTAVAHDSRTSGMANLVASTMASIWHNIDALDGVAAEAAETGFTTTLAAASGPGDLVGDARRESCDAALRASINRYVATHLRGDDLAPAAVARRFAISVRKLHALYEGSGCTFAQSVMRLRVEACARDLATSSRTITEIATTWGFYDLSHLNRVFRAHRGCLPSEYRVAAEAS